MKKWMTVFALGGMLSTTGLVQSSTIDNTALAPATAQATGDELPCSWCCPIDICGFNGPSFDGTTADAECSAK